MLNTQILKGNFLKCKLLTYPYTHSNNLHDTFDTFRQEALEVLRVAEKHRLHYRTWIGTEAYGSNNALKNFNASVIAGFFGVIPEQFHLQEFEDRLGNITKTKSNDNPWLEQYWLEKGEPNLLSLPRNKFLNVINAVYAFAHAINSTITSKTSKQKKFTPKQLLKQLQNVNFISKNRERVQFDQEGNPKSAKYTLTNLQYNQTNKNWKFEKVMTWFSRDRHIDRHDKVTLYFANEDDPRQNPLSSCSKPCSPGFYGLKFENDSCCWECTRCKEGYIQPLPGQLNCTTKCEGGEIPNKNQTKCIIPQQIYYQAKSTSGIILIVLTTLVAAVIIFFMVTINHYRSTPVAMALNQSLSNLQLISMLITLLLPCLFFIAPPCMVTCSVFLFAFVSLYTITLSVVLMKADRLLRIFNASKSNSLHSRSKLKTNGVQFCMVALLTFIALIVCLSVYIVFRPTVKVDISYDGPQITSESSCAGYFKSIFFVDLGFMFIIAAACGVYAFRARKLPENYNEATFTYFSMFIFLLIWMICIVIYISAHTHAAKLETILYVSLTSVFEISVLMYGQKTFIILFRPQQNTKEFVSNLLKERALSKAVNTSLTGSIPNYMSGSVPHMGNDSNRNSYRFKAHSLHPVSNASSGSSLNLDSPRAHVRHHTTS